MPHGARWVLTQVNTRRGLSLKTTGQMAHVPAGVHEERMMADQEYIHFSPPVIGEEEIDEVVETLRSMWITTGPKTRRFEQDFGHYLGAQGALALNSCTAALHTALTALHIGAGDEVITTPITFAATANVIEQVGARPVLVDVEPDTLNIHPEGVARAITPRTKAILPVYYAGHPVDLDPYNALAESH